MIQPHGPRLRIPITPLPKGPLIAIVPLRAQTPSGLIKWGIEGERVRMCDGLSNGNYLVPSTTVSLGKVGFDLDHLMAAGVLEKLNGNLRQCTEVCCGRNMPVLAVVSSGLSMLHMTNWQRLCGAASSSQFYH